MAALRAELSRSNCATAVAAGREGECDVADFHIPIGPRQDVVLTYYTLWLCDEDLSLVDIATRRQGLLVRYGNPKEMFSLGNLRRADVRFINRQAGSGTRLLLEELLKAQRPAAADIAGVEHGEYTYAACGQRLADVGFGLEPPECQFKLDFVPLCRCPAALLPAVPQQVPELTAGEAAAGRAAGPGFQAGAELARWV